MKIVIFLALYVNLIYCAPEGFSRHRRIVGGNPVKLGEIPYHAFVVGTSMCGGSLITRTWILTAAGCIYNASNVEAVLGWTDWRVEPVWLSNPFTSDRIIINPNFEREPGVFARHNIALLDLRGSPPIPDSPYIQPISLPLVSDGNINLAGRVGTASGFGVDQTGNYADVLNAIDLTVLDDSQCVKDENWFHPGHICTANPGQAMICLGDTGGPFAMEIEPGRRVVIAIISFVSGNSNDDGFFCYEGVPSAFLTVNPYLNWIFSVIGS